MKDQEVTFSSIQLMISIIVDDLSGGNILQTSDHQVELGQPHQKCQPRMY